MVGARKGLRSPWLVLALALLTVLVCTACGGSGDATSSADEGTSKRLDTSHFLTAVEEEPDTVDFQCTSIHYTIATNVFDRLLEMKSARKGGIDIKPSLAETWEESEDGKTYTFHLREGVTFSNGSPLTAEDVRYTFTRLLTHPDSCNQDIALSILGASELASGEASELAGFEVLGDHDFAITLEEPFEGFLACLTMPGASILDEETTEEAGELFGTTAESTIGTGPFVLHQWEAGSGMVLVANETYWGDPAQCEGVNLRFITEPEEVRALFENGKLDILDLDDLGNSAEFFTHGDIYQDRIYEVPQIGISYIALNESVAPLDDVRVRKALQLALDRKMLLDAVHSGRGAVENGIYPQGLYGYNPGLAQIAYDPAQAKELLKEAGYGDGVDLTFTVKASSTRWEMALAELAVSMWKEVGVSTTIKVISESDFMEQRTSGKLACYTATWTADYNDPDNFICTFFGSEANTTYRSLCYPRKDIMARVIAARGIHDPEARIAEYRELERIIVQEDAAWIPLFSRKRLYVTSERLQSMPYAWNGSVKNVYSKMAISTG